jgi:hypothetical protein
MNFAASIASAPLISSPPPSIITSISGSRDHIANCSGPGRRAWISNPLGSASGATSSPARAARFFLQSSRFTVSPFSLR